MTTYKRLSFWLLLVFLLLPYSSPSSPPPPPPYPPPPENPNPSQWYSVGGYSPSSPPQVVRGSQIQKWQKSGVVTPSQIRTPSNPLPPKQPAQLNPIARTPTLVHLFRIISLYYLGNQAYQVLYAAAVSTAAFSTSPSPSTATIINIPTLSNFVSSLAKMSKPSPVKVAIVSSMLVMLMVSELYNFARLNNVSNTLKTLNALTSQYFNLPRSNVNTLLKIVILTITVFNPNYTTLHKYLTQIFSNNFLSSIKTTIPFASFPSSLTNSLPTLLNKVKLPHLTKSSLSYHKLLNTMKEIKIKSTLDAILSSASTTATKISATAGATSSTILNNHPNLNIDLLKHLTVSTIIILSTFLVSFTLVSLISARYNESNYEEKGEATREEVQSQKLEKYKHYSSQSNQKWINDNFAYVASTLINPSSTTNGLVSVILKNSSAVNWKLIVKNLMLIEVHVLPLVVLFNVSNLSSFNKILTAYFTGWHLYYSSLSFSKLRTLNQHIHNLNHKVTQDTTTTSLLDGKVEADVRVEDYWVARNNKWIVPGLSFSIEAGKVTVLKGYGGRDAMRCILKLDEGRGSQVVRGGVTGDKLVKWFDRTKEEEWVALAGRSGNNNKNSSNNNNDPAYAVANKICQEKCFQNFLSRICRFKEVEDTLKGYLIVVEGEALNEKVLIMLRKAGASVVMFEGNGDETIDMDYFWQGV